MKRRMTAPLAVISLIMAACGSPPNPSQAGPQPTETSTPQVDEVSTDWNNPFGGVEVPGIQAAQQLLPFHVRAPRSLGEPVKVILTPPEYVPDQKAVAFLYDAPPYGRVVVMQHFPDVPLDEWKQSNETWVSMNGQPGVSGTSEFATIRGGIAAFVTTSHDGSLSSVFWLEDEVEFIVMGPNLDRTKALEVAEKI